MLCIYSKGILLMMRNCSIKNVVVCHKNIVLINDKSVFVIVLVVIQLVHMAVGTERT